MEDKLDKNREAKNYLIVSFSITGKTKNFMVE
jgi:hypothetical protein